MDDNKKEVVEDNNLQENDLAQQINAWIPKVLGLELNRIDQEKTAVFSAIPLRDYYDFNKDGAVEEYRMIFAEAFFRFCNSFSYVQATSSYKGNIVDTSESLSEIIDLLNEGINIAYKACYEQVNRFQFELIIEKYTEAIQSILSKKSSVMMYSFSDPRDKEYRENEQSNKTAENENDANIDSVFNTFKAIIDALDIRDLYPEEKLRLDLEEMSLSNYGYISEHDVRNTIVGLLKNNNRVLQIHDRDTPKDVVNKVNEFIKDSVVDLTIVEQEDFSNEYDEEAQINYKIELSISGETIKTNMNSGNNDFLMERINELLTKQKDFTIVELIDLDQESSTRSYCKCNVELFKAVLAKFPESAKTVFEKPYKSYSPIWKVQ